MSTKKPRTVEELVDQHYETMFEWLCDGADDDIKEFKIIVKLASSGKTIRRSWADRDRWLSQSELR